MDSTHSVELIGSGILAIMILKEVFAFLKYRNGNGRNDKIDLYNIQTSLQSIQEDIQQIKTESKDLWIWHNKEDPEEPGVKVWYANRKRTEDALVKICKSIEKQTEVLQALLIDIKELKRSLIK